MKNLTLLLFAGALILSSCGDKETTEEKSEEIEKRELNADLEKLINNLAACEAQNTNCEAYTVASEKLPELVKDDAKRKVIVGDLVYIIRTGEDAKKQAAAHALNFWSGTRDFKDDATYGKQIIEALKGVKDPEEGYGSTGAQIGQVLANWWYNDDKELRSQLIASIKDKKMCASGRSELVRLISRDILDDKEVFDALMTIVKDKNEETIVKNYEIMSLSMVQKADNKTSARTQFEGMLSSSEVQISGNALRGLGYLGATESLDKISATIRAHKNDNTWYSYGSGCLSDLIRNGGDNLDKDAVYTLINEMLTHKEMEDYYRSYFISPLHQLKTPASKALMSKMKASSEEDIAKEAERVSKY